MPNDFLYERMFKFHEFAGKYGMITIRAWIADKGQYPEYFEQIIKKIINSIKSYCYTSFFEIRGLARTLTDIDGVNAIEVVDRNGNGSIVYKDWP